MIERLVIKKLNIAIIGLGKQGTEVFLPDVLASSFFNLQAICDINEEKILEIKNKYLQEDFRTYIDYKELYEQEDLDCVILALPHDQYIKNIEIAAHKNINILKEKPLARNIEEGNVIEEIAKAHQIKVMISCQLRFDPIFLKVEELIKHIGNISFTKLYYALPSPNPNDRWRSSKLVAGGGVLLDIGYHLIDLVLWYLGKPTITHTQTTNNYPDRYDVEDTAIMNFNIDQKIQGEIFVSCNYPVKKMGMFIMGDNGSIMVLNSKIEVRDKSHKLIGTHEFPKSNASTLNVLESFYKLNIGENKNEYLEPSYHNANHVSLLEAAYINL